MLGLRQAVQRVEERRAQLLSPANGSSISASTPTVRANRKGRAASTA